MNAWVKGGLALGGLAVGLGALRRALNPAPRYAPWEKPPYGDFENKVLVLGGGFGGYTAAKDLCELTRGRDDVGVLVLAKNNFFTFWPMVPGIVSSDIDARNVAQPLRRALIADGGIEFPYDHVVISLGGLPNFFGIPGVEEHSLTMRGVEDAERIRNRVIERFEEVSLIRGEVPQSKLTFVVIGGGATGVETASEIHTLVHEALTPDYPNIDPHRVRIYLLEALPHILPELDPALRRAARARMVNQRIEVMTNAMAEEISEDYVNLKGGRNIETENVIWTAGNRPNVGIEAPGLPADERTGIKVDEYLRVEGHSNAWAIGDCAAVSDIREEEDKLVPPTAQAAVQEGHVVARNVLAAIDGR